MFVCVVSLCTCAVVQASSQRPTWGVCPCFEAGRAIHRPGQFAVELGVFSCSLSYAQIRLKLLHLTLAVFWGSKLRSSHLFTSALDLPIHSQSPHGLGEFVQMYFVCIFVACTCACASCACCPVIVNDNSKAIYFLCCILQDPFLLLLSTNFMLYITYSCAL